MDDSDAIAIPEALALTEEERQKVQALYKRIADKYADLHKLYRCLVRYLKARDWNLNKSEEMLRESLKWRAEFKPEAIDRDEIVPLFELMSMYAIGTTKNGERIVYVTPGAHNPYPVELRIRYLVYLLEHVISLLDEERTDMEKIVWIIDFSQFGQRAKDPASKHMMKTTLHILNINYPERLSKCFIVDTPWYFSLFWAIAKPFVSSNTRNKIVFLKGSLEHKRDVLLNLIDEAQLDEKFGGTLRITTYMKQHWDSQEVLQAVASNKSVSEPANNK